MSEKTGRVRTRSERRQMDPADNTDEIGDINPAPVSDDVNDAGGDLVLELINALPAADRGLLDTFLTVEDDIIQQLKLLTKTWAQLNRMSVAKLTAWAAKNCRRAVPAMAGKTRKSDKVDALVAALAAAKDDCKIQPNGSVEIVSLTDEEISEHDALESKVAAYKKSVDDAYAIKKANRESGKSKLKALGLSDDEIAALLGNT